MKKVFHIILYYIIGIKFALHLKDFIVNLKRNDVMQKPKYVDFCRSDFLK